MCVRRLVNVCAIFLRPSGAWYVFTSCPTAHAVGYLLTALRACRLRKGAEFRCQYPGDAHRPLVMMVVAVGKPPGTPCPLGGLASGRWFASKLYRGRAFCDSSRTV